MFCPNCGTENAEGATFCASCGSAMNATPVQQDAPAAAPVEETVETTKKDLLAPLKPLLEKVEPIVQKYKLFVAGALGILALVICISILASLFSGNGFIAVKEHIEVFVEDGEVVIVNGAKKAKPTGLEAEGINTYTSSLNGKILVLLTDNGDLAVVKGTKLTKIDDEVVSFRMSVDGTGVAYVTNEDGEKTLHLYNVKNKKSKEVSDEVYGSSYVLSPNGDSLAYFEKGEDDDEAKLMYFKGSKSTKITSNEVSLKGLSNNGKFIYASGKNDDGKTILYAFNKKGDRDKLGTITTSYVFFNDDHTQVMFFSEGKTYISKNGKEAVKVSSSEASMVTPNSAGIFYDVAITYPTDDLYNKVYSCGGNLWYIRKNVDKSSKLANDATSITLSEDGKFVYYVNKGELKVLKVSHGDRAADKAKVLAEDVNDYVVTSDRKKVYYTSDSSLYAVNGKNGKGKKTIANDDVGSYLYINGKDVVYYEMENDVYATKNGSKGKKVLSDAEISMQTGTGVVYFEGEDAIYATKGAKKPTKIHTYEN